MYRTGMGRDGGRINKTLRFCRRCIDVVLILSSLMSTCELDRFVIQTPYIKVVKSCSAPFVDRLRRQAGRDGRMDGRRRTNGRTKELLSIFLVLLFFLACHSPRRFIWAHLHFSGVWGTLRDFEKKLLISSIDSHFRDESQDILYTRWQALVLCKTIPIHCQWGIKGIEINLKLAVLWMSNGHQTCKKRSNDVMKSCNHS